MGIRSMTGFGIGEASDNNYTVRTEIKSVNHRFRDVRFKMSSLFSSIEMELRKELEKIFSRGSFEIVVNYKKKSVANAIDVDWVKVESFLDKLQAMTMSKEVPLHITPSDILRQDFAVDMTDKLRHDLYPLVLTSFSQSLESLNDSRSSEGKKLREVLLKHKKEFERFYTEVITLADKYKKVIKTRLEKRLKEYLADTKVDEPRYLQEVIYYLEKLDIHEEIDRIKVHLSKLDKILEDDGEVGRKVDFILQELNRETNTIGSKTGQNEISECVVEMKVYLEKMREQALNIE